MGVLSVQILALWALLPLGLAADAGPRPDAGATAADQAPAPGKPERVELRGRAMPLNKALEALGVDVPLAAAAEARPLVLLADDRSIVPLLDNDASRALFLDVRLRAGRVAIEGRRFAGVPYVQVVSLRVERDGRFQTPEYHCGVCSINVRSPQLCPCCQGPMELRMRPDRE